MAESGQSDRIPPDFDDPALYDVADMTPQCAYIVHGFACRLDKWHGGKHSPGRASAAPPEPPLDYDRMVEAGFLDAYLNIAGVEDEAWAAALLREDIARYDGMGGAAPERLPSVEDWTRLASLIVEKPVGNWPSLWERLASIHGGPQDSSRREAGEMLADLWASLHEEPEGTTRPVDPE